MTGAAVSDAPEPVRRVAGAAWSFRCKVEREAELRFARLSRDLALIGAAPELSALALRASLDERRHAVLCAELAAAYGEPVPPSTGTAVAEIAPRGLLPRGRVLYEIVAACCITETESMAVLTTLLAHARRPRLRAVLRELAADEVAHSRLGWAHLAGESARGVAGFLGPLVPRMLEGGAEPDLFRTAPVGLDDEALLGHGVLPRAVKREVFTRTLVEVVFPGLERFGVDAAPGRAWLDGKRAELSAASPAP